MRYNDNTPQAAAYRAEQADVDCDIEGMANDPRISELRGQLRAAGLETDEIIRRCADAIRNLEPVLAAE